MMKDVLINIRTTQDDGEQDQDFVELTSDGMYTFDGEVACLTYMESEVTGMEGTRTSLIVMPDQVVLDRDGMITSRIIFREGDRSSFLYNTPYGTATMNVSTRQIRRSFGHEGGELEIDYVVDMEHSLMVRNKLQVTVREQKQIGEQTYA